MSVVQDCREILERCQRAVYQVHDQLLSWHPQSGQHSFQPTIPDPDAYLATRRGSIGITPCFAMVEYFHSFDLPDFVSQDKSLRKSEKIALELIIFQNDVLSFPKEQAEDVNHNFVALPRQKGLTAQEAYNHINKML